MEASTLAEQNDIKVKGQDALKLRKNYVLYEKTTSIAKNEEWLCSGLNRSQKMNATDFTKTDTTMNKLQNVSGAGRKPDHRLIDLSNVNVSLGLNQHQSTSEELKNTKTGGYDTEISWKRQERNDPKKKYKQRAEHFKKIKSFFENCSDSKHSDCKTTQMSQKEKIEIGSKEWRNLTPSGKTDSGHVTDRKTSNIDNIFKDDKSICSGLERNYVKGLQHNKRLFMTYIPDFNDIEYEHKGHSFPDKGFEMIHSKYCKRGYIDEFKI
uniref:Uncharacterized protein n=1 Tax=Magallana gigas TaxID=29159 RepID=K1Q3D2_MAGGI